MGEAARLPGANIALFTPGQATLACFLGTLLGGGVIVALNHDRLGRRNTALMAFFVGLVASFALSAVALLLAKSPASSALRWSGIVFALGVRQHATRTQKPWVDAHVAAGGKRASWWTVVGISLVALLVHLVPFAVLYFVYFVYLLVTGAPENP